MLALECNQISGNRHYLNFQLKNTLVVVIGGFRKIFSQVVLVDNSLWESKWNSCQNLAEYEGVYRVALEQYWDAIVPFTY